MKKRHFILVVVGIFLTMGAGIFRPVPKLPENELLITEGKISDIFEAGYKDVVFQLEGSERQFYINRGVEQGMDIRELKDELVGKEVTIKYPDYWTILDPKKKIRHISKIETQEEIIFTEI